MSSVTVVGLGYVGLSVAALLSRHHTVTAIDIDSERVALLTRGELPVQDPDLLPFISKSRSRIHFTTDTSSYATADFVVIATPTDYDERTNAFDTTSVEEVVSAVRQANRMTTIVIKSTVPVGFVQSLREKLGTDRVMFSPEFLREGRALHDNLYPSRIVVGDVTPEAKQFASMLAEAAEENDVPILLTRPSEAEAIKLFSNTYLAMRVAFFNELDSFAIGHGLTTRDVIEGVGLDPRIGMHYNNPSFGYGGYCLPKDTKQLLANYADVPQTLVRAVVDANATRKDFIAAEIASRRPGIVGVYRLVMKSGSDNVRSSSVISIVRRLQAKGIDVLAYEPDAKAGDLPDLQLCNDLVEFKATVDLIVANRIDSDLSDVASKVYTRDLYGSDA